MRTTVTVKKEVVRVVEQERAVYLSACEDYIVLMIGNTAVLNINKKTLKLIVNDLEYEQEIDYDYNDNYKFRNITKWWLKWQI